jgi:exopolyphosphatase/guanosine-5'-triphosphate,3'-diphosphate pyrophosphatase
MREAKNGSEIIDEIYQKCGLSIEIISGNTEADLIFQNKDDDELKSDVPYLFIDVGGGSTELSLFKNKKLIASQSFNLGTVRMLHNQINPKEWDFLDYWIEENVRKYKNVVAIGSGGNINKLYKIAKRKTNKPLILEQLVEINSLLSKMNVSQRIAKYGLNPDRADVIVPAAKIYIHAMKAAEIHEILVPQIGVSDGIVHQLYEDFKQKNKH